MKKTIALLMLLVVVASLGATTYYAGLDGSVVLSNIAAGKGYRDYKYKESSGYKVSIPVVMMFTKNFGLDTGVLLYEKNYNYSQTVTAYGQTQKNFDLDIRNLYLEFPLAFRSSVAFDELDFYCSLGGYIGALLYGERSGEVMNINGTYDKVNEITDLSLYNRFDAGVSAKVGVGVNMGRFRFYYDAEYDYSLTDLNKWQRHGAYHIHNASFALTFGLLWRINK